MLENKKLSFENKEIEVTLQRSNKKVIVETKDIFEILELLQVFENATLWDELANEDFVKTFKNNKSEVNPFTFPFLVKALRLAKDELRKILPRFIGNITEEEFQKEKLTLTDLINILLAIYEANDLGEDIKNLIPLLKGTRVGKILAQTVKE